MHQENNQAGAFLKWAGGKRWLANNYNHMFPDNYNNYFEPFLGSGAVFFAISPVNSVLSDLNQDLIDTYNAIKENPKHVVRLLKKHDSLHSRDYYYYIRKSKPRALTSKAARIKTVRKC